LDGLFRGFPTIEMKAFLTSDNFQFSIFHFQFIERRFILGKFDGKKVVIIGDRDGIPGPAIEECIKTTGADVVFSSTECFV